MKKRAVAILIMSGIMIQAVGAEMDTAKSIQIQIVTGQHRILIHLLDHPASRDLLKQLPLDIIFRDFAEEEKITMLPHRLTTQSSPRPIDERGDFTYYEPWGNLAVFYNGFASDNRLIVLGHIESGKEYLAGMTTDFSARIERVSPKLFK